MCQNSKEQHDKQQKISLKIMYKRNAFETNNTKKPRNLLIHADKCKNHQQYRIEIFSRTSTINMYASVCAAHQHINNLTIFFSIVLNAAFYELFTCETEFD